MLRSGHWALCESRFGRRAFAHVVRCYEEAKLLKVLEFSCYFAIALRRKVLLIYGIMSKSKMRQSIIKKQMIKKQVIRKQAVKK
ncbi:hypothetical protein BFG52_06810 [Acinetobacter larvae]|uniref:Uncharacterized protein n=1 Tax=Acinetobacter larvae TaxID=1789224 RepID=A0A1B2LYT7_9GAMM|nr:hypothetical protein BFG52_06810 [Acinetobacter larvae]